MRVSCGFVESPRQYAPASAGELDRLDRRRGLEVRAAAEVGEVALGVEADVAVGGVDELDLVRLVLGRRSTPSPRRGRAPRALHSRPSASSRRISSSMRARSSSAIGSGKSKS